MTPPPDQVHGSAQGRQSLAGVTVAVTRPASRSESLLTSLADLGVRTFLVPLIEFAPPADGGAGLRSVAGRLATFDWAVVTSRTAVDHLVAVAGTLYGRLPAWAAVGPATAAALRHAGAPEVLVADRAGSAPLAEALPPPPEGKPGRILLVQAERPWGSLEAHFRRKGWAVEAVAAYSTVARRPSPNERKNLQSCDLIVLASPSAVRSLVECATTGRPVICLGQSTAGVARDLDLDVRDVVVGADSEALRQAILTAIGWRR